MRENIGLYRGKGITYGEWFYGYYYKAKYYRTDKELCDYITVPHPNEEGRASDHFMIDPETVGQYTGRTDKNSKKIFEDDIVRADGYIFVVRYGKCGGVPNADNYGYMGFYLEALSEGTKLCAKYGLRDDICYFEDIEVIGNIHDNPELL